MREFKDMREFMRAFKNGELEPHTNVKIGDKIAYITGCEEDFRKKGAT